MTRFHGRGGIYVVVLATACIVTIIGLASMATWRLQAAAANATADAAEARLNANSAVEAAAYYLNSDSNWRTNRSQGTWWSGVSIGRGTYAIAGTDPTDGDFTNRPYDNLLLTCTGRAGAATHVLTVTLKPQGTPIAALANAVTTVGQLHVNSGLTLTASGAPAYTNGELRLDGNIAGSARCFTLNGSASSASGGVTLLAPSLPMPDPSVFTMYASIGTVIAPGTTINNAVLGPGVNSLGGSVNPDGVYVINATGDITIQKLRVLGTLVIINTGHKVTISGPVFMQPARSDYPALLVKGQLVLQYDSTTTLSEASAGFNFNPIGAAYQGATDSDTADTYPCEIQGLVHSTDQSLMLNNALIRGAFICESNASSDAVRLNGNAAVIYDPTLYSNPPMGYTTSVTMKILAGSWQQSVLP